MYHCGFYLYPISCCYMYLRERHNCSTMCNVMPPGTITAPHQNTEKIAPTTVYKSTYQDSGPA